MNVCNATCPECEWKFQVEEPEVNEVIVCTDCRLNLKVISIDINAKSVAFELCETASDDWGQ